MVHTGEMVHTREMVHTAKMVYTGGDGAHWGDGTHWGDMLIILLFIVALSCLRYYTNDNIMNSCYNYSDNQQLI